MLKDRTAAYRRPDTATSVVSVTENAVCTVRKSAKVIIALGSQNLTLSHPPLFPLFSLSQLDIGLLFLSLMIMIIIIIINEYD